MEFHLTQIVQHVGLEGKELLQKESKDQVFLFRFTTSLPRLKIRKYFLIKKKYKYDKRKINFTYEKRNLNKNCFNNI